MDDVGDRVTDVLTTFSFLLSLGRLGNDDNDGIEILKKSKGLASKTLQWVTLVVTFRCAHCTTVT